LALPADMHEQLEQAEARVRLVPRDEMPPAEEVLAQVQRWQKHVHEAAEAIRRADDVIEQLAGMPEVAAAERESMLAMARSVRAEAFTVMQQPQSGSGVVLDGEMAGRPAPGRGRCRGWSRNEL